MFPDYGFFYARLISLNAKYLNYSLGVLLSTLATLARKTGEIDFCAYPAISLAFYPSLV